MIVLFSSGGRTGNELFQVSHAMSARRAREWLVTFRFGSTKALLSRSSKRRWLNIESKLVRMLADSFLFPVLYHLFVRTGLISYLHDRKSCYTLRRGKFPYLTIMKGYFESFPQLEQDLSHYFRLNARLLSHARSFLESMTTGRAAVFVHLRRTDLKDLEKDPFQIKRMLPDRYYGEGIRILQRRQDNLFFVIVGDDPRYAESLFKDVEPKYISHLSMAEDLAVMSCCAGGVLSHSTFAWWGAFFGNGRLGYVVPNYWHGHVKKIWHPPEIKAPFMTDFVEVI